jgi:hypothetical protein
MKIFISWSGSLSRNVAEALRDWLPSILEYVEPYVSSQDINKGARWTVEIARELESSQYGIICVTPGDLGRPWLNFEAGALAKSFEAGHLSPFLFGIERSGLGGPLSQFQSTLYDRSEVLALARSINSYASAPLHEHLLERVFNQMWPSLQETLDQLIGSAVAEREVPERESDAKITELLELARAQALAPAASPARVPGPRIQVVPPGDVDTNELTFLLARLRAATSSIPLTPPKHRSWLG